MKHIFMDTNVVVDFLTPRQPFAFDAALLFKAAVQKKARIYIAAISYNNIHYLLRRSVGNASALQMLDELASMTEIVDLTGSIIRKSLKADFRDYEDAIQYYSALSVPDIDFIVTRNSKDLKKSTLAVLTPAEAVKAINQ